MNGGRRGVFLDRDGTLNEEVHYIRTPDELRVIAGAGAAVRKLNDRGVTTCVISNQSGVARGYVREADLVPIHARLEQELARDGGRIDRIYYCPHHPTDGKAPYNIDCTCRKPKTGMLLRGANELGIDLERSFVVGDSLVDIQAGTAVAATTILVMTGYGARTLEQCASGGCRPHHVAPTIVEAIDHILNTLSGEQTRNA